MGKTIIRSAAVAEISERLLKGWLDFDDLRYDGERVTAGVVAAICRVGDGIDGCGSVVQVGPVSDTAMPLLRNRQGSLRC